MVATPGLLLLQVPPAVASVRAALAPAQIAPGPDIADTEGPALMLMTAEALAPQLKLLVTV
jgi:hypothetical protein